MLIVLTFFESLKITLINMVTVLMISVNMATLDLRNKGYDVIIFIYEVTNIILSHDLNYAVNVVR